MYAFDWTELKLLMKCGWRVRDMRKMTFMFCAVEVAGISSSSSKMEGMEVRAKTSISLSLNLGHLEASINGHW